MTDCRSETRLILALTALPKIGRKTAARLLATFQVKPQHPEELACAVNEALKDSRSVPRVTDGDASNAFTKADDTLDRASELGLQVLPRGTPSFPSRLSRIPDPPLLLYVRGNLELLSMEESVAIIGTREPTDFGSRSAHRFALRCAEAGLVVVSGLAKGCDAAAHEGCLEANGKTVAVLAHGLDTVYPATHRDLASRIVDGGGTLLSEYGPGTRARSNFFIERDRLQSGLARAILVIETDIKGGTMHTVRFALEQGRRVACLNHPDHLHAERQTRGTQQLIRDGRAIPLTNGPDLAQLIDDVKSGESSRNPSVGQDVLFPMDGSS